MDLEVPGAPKRVASLISKGKEEPKVEEKAPPKEKEEEKVEKKEEESPTHELQNPARVAEKQRNVISFAASRYAPILPNRKSGICFLRDSTSGESDKYLGVVEP